MAKPRMSMSIHFGFDQDENLPEHFRGAFRYTILRDRRLAGVETPARLAIREAGDITFTRNGDARLDVYCAGRRIGYLMEKNTLRIVLACTPGSGSFYMSRIISCEPCRGVVTISIGLYRKPVPEDLIPLPGLEEELTLNTKPFGRRPGDFYHCRAGLGDNNEAQLVIPSPKDKGSYSMPCPMNLPGRNDGVVVARVENVDTENDTVTVRLFLDTWRIEKKW